MTTPSSAKVLRTAVIVRTSLPGPLERVRRRSVGDARAGVPAHLTLLYPFVAATDLTGPVRARLRAAAQRHAPFDYRLTAVTRWPDTIYVAVEPVTPFVNLQADLADAFPDYPIYHHDPGFVFVPHITVAEGPLFDDPRLVGDPALSRLPSAARAAGLEVIVEGHDGRWRTRWQIRLGDTPPR